MSYIELPENPEFNSQMRKLETTDPAAADLFNSLFKQLLENEVSIVNGTVNVGNADKLDGKDSTEFALKTELAERRNIVVSDTEPTDTTAIWIK